MMRVREVRLRSRPVGMPTLDDFAIVETDLPTPGTGEVQVRNLFMSVDPYMRGRMIDRASYVPPFKLDAVLQGSAIGEVVASGTDEFVPGDMVTSTFGWREAFTTRPAYASLVKVETHGLPPESFLAAFGMTGLTAYVGLKRIAGVQAGETVFISAAAGAVGQVACQIAKLNGATVIGSAGGAEKVAFLKELGVDHAIDYKAERNLTVALAKAVPEGIDVYFDNVGGTHLEAALNAARPHARFAMCGMISSYNDEVPADGPTNLLLVVGKSLRLEGFIVSNHLDLQPAFVREMQDWLNSGRLTQRETIDDGIASAPAAFIKLFTGASIGKMLVRL